MDATPEQRAVSQRVGATPDAPAPDSRLGVAGNLRDRNLWPLNGLRHPPEQGTNGWYIWRGDVLGEAEDFFKPLHTAHLEDWCPEAVPFIGLPPGWRFLVAPGHEDVWYDAALLST